MHGSNIFEHKSVAKTLFLCIVTFGFFVSFRLYTITKTVNKHVAKPFPDWFTVSGLLVHFASLVGLVSYFTLNTSQDVLFYSKVMHVLSSIYHLVWLLQIRGRINNLLDARQGDPLWLNRRCIAFLHVVYIQYKINQVIRINDEKIQNLNSVAR